MTTQHSLKTRTLISSLCFDYNNFKHIFELFELSIKDVYFETFLSSKCDYMETDMAWISPTSALNYFQDDKKLLDPITGESHTISVLIKGTWCLLSEEDEKPFDDDRESAEILRWIKETKYVSCRSLVALQGLGDVGDNYVNILDNK
jgi:hypothetical protein